MGDQVVAADHALAVAHQELQQVKNLRLKPHQAAGMAEPAPAHIEAEIFKQVRTVRGDTPARNATRTKIARLEGRASRLMV